MYYIVSSILLIILGLGWMVAVYKQHGVYNKYINLQQQCKDKKIILGDLEQKNIQLKNEITKLRSTQRVQLLEQLAREKLGMVKAGEKFIGSNNGEKTNGS